MVVECYPPSFLEPQASSRLDAKVSHDYCVLTHGIGKQPRHAGQPLFDSAPAQRAGGCSAPVEERPQIAEIPMLTSV